MIVGIMLIEKSLECMCVNLWRNYSFCVKYWILGLYVSWRNFSYVGFYIDLIMQFLKCVFLVQFVCRICIYVLRFWRYD